MRTAEEFRAEVINRSRAYIKHRRRIIFSCASLAVCVIAGSGLAINFSNGYPAYSDENTDCAPAQNIKNILENEHADKEQSNNSDSVWNYSGNTYGHAPGVASDVVSVLTEHGAIAVADTLIRQSLSDHEKYSFVSAELSNEMWIISYSNGSDKMLKIGVDRLSGSAQIIE